MKLLNTLIAVLLPAFISFADWKNIVTWEDESGWQYVQADFFYDAGGNWLWSEGAQVWVYVYDPSVPQAPEGFSYIPAGTFTMGSPADEPGHNSSETQHSVTLPRDFHLQQTEVTKAEWDAVAAQGPALGYTDLPAGRDGFLGNSGGTHPVTEVNWYDVIKWLNLKSELAGFTPCYFVDGATYKTGQSVPEYNFLTDGYRLPTESEWEYACRAGTTTAFYSGPIDPITTLDCTVEENLEAIAWYCGNSGTDTHPVGGKLANDWDLYDMSGNVYELCWDWFGNYPGTVTDPVGPSSGSSRVIRGGHFGRIPRDLRSANRLNALPGDRSRYVGFRPARTKIDNQ